MVHLKHGAANSIKFPLSVLEYHDQDVCCTERSNLTQLNLRLEPVVVALATTVRHLSVGADSPVPRVVPPYRAR